MEQSLRIKADELSLPLIEGLKKYFHAINAKEITISFSTPKSVSTQKKKYLYEETQEEANARIEKSLDNMDKESFISFTGEEFLQLSKALSNMK